MPLPVYPRLLADVGGTNARFAWASTADAPLSVIANYRCADHGSLHAAIGQYLRDHDRPAPQACAIGIANPVLGDQVRMSNHHWVVLDLAAEDAAGGCGDRPAA